MKRATLLTFIAVLGAATALAAQVPSIINCQGRLSASGTNIFHGPGLFKLALRDGGTDLH